MQAARRHADRQRARRDARSAAAARRGDRDQGRAHPRRRLRGGAERPQEHEHPRHRRRRPHRHPRHQRRAHALHPRRPDLHQRGALGRRAVARRGHAPRARAGAAHAGAALGAGDRRLDLGAVRREALPDARRDQRRHRRHAVHDHAPLRPRLARTAAAVRVLGWEKEVPKLFGGYVERDAGGNTDRPGDVDHQPRQPGGGVAARAAPLARGADHLDAPFHARAQPPRRHQRDRRRRRRAELPGQLRRHRQARRRQPAHAAHRLRAVRAGAGQGARATTRPGRRW